MSRCYLIRLISGKPHRLESSDVNLSVSQYPLPSGLPESEIDELYREICLESDRIAELTGMHFASVDSSLNHDIQGSTGRSSVVIESTR